MKNVIICEGNTDLVLIQYFLETVYNWVHIKEKDYKKFSTALIHPIPEVRGLKWFQHSNGNILAIIAAGGVSRINNMLSIVLDINKIDTGTEKSFGRVVIITDRDEVGTEIDFIEDLTKTFLSFDIEFVAINNNNWNSSIFENSIGIERNIEFLPLIIPFEDTGAIETFLLKALSDESDRKDPQKIDRYVIEQCIKFIDEIDCKGKYLKKRRHITKAKFNAVFTVMTPAEAFGKRDSLLRSVPWEQYTMVQSTFEKLENLLEP